MLEDSTDVGEEDSFLGQTSGVAPASSYFSSPVTTSDPFASIGQTPCPPSAMSAASGPPSFPNSISAAPTPPAAAASQLNPPPQMFGSAVYQSPVGRHTPPPTALTPPPPQTQPQGHNPYRHTPTSSRASPYIPAPEILLPAAHAPQQNPYSLSSPPQMFPPSGPTFSTVGGATLRLDVKTSSVSFPCITSPFLLSLLPHTFKGLRLQPCLPALWSPQVR